MINQLDTSKFSPKKLKTYRTIISCAKREFALKGYVNTTISTIAKSAQISVGCIYKYFENKDVLYEYIITQEQDNIKRRLNLAIHKCKTREEKERAGLREWLFYVRENPGIYKMIWESLFINIDAFAHYYSSFARSYSSALKKEKDELTSEDYEVISYVLIGISNFLGIKLMIENITSDEEIEAIADKTIHILKVGLFK